MGGMGRPCGLPDCCPTSELGAAEWGEQQEPETGPVGLCRKEEEELMGQAWAAEERRQHGGTAAESDRGHQCAAVRLSWS
ncbi:hypothetical protein NDU88_001573 [Pleurodeles waltl]|uniref:Uncharacterized protein n=1 Tax=Pleurodeles waltl TaxID=8319 RepID=A0AAV7MT51_PLEWA|nr:hypothetical protein NDU88_001573 [Pleurodeles waltl]